MSTLIVLLCCLQDNNPPNAGREPDTDDNHAIEALMQNHDVLLSTFRSRLTKLQVSYFVDLHVMLL